MYIENWTGFKLNINRLNIFEKKYKRILNETKDIRNIARFYTKTKRRIEKINKHKIIVESKFIDMLNFECFEINELIDKYYSAACYDEMQDVLNKIRVRCFIIKSILNNIEMNIEHD